MHALNAIGTVLIFIGGVTAGIILLLGWVILYCAALEFFNKRRSDAQSLNRYYRWLKKEGKQP